MELVSSDEYRDKILEYFKDKDKYIYLALIRNINDWRYPFANAHYLYEASKGEIDILSFLAFSKIINKYKNPIISRDEFSGDHDRDDWWLQNKVESGEIYDIMKRLGLSTYIADKIITKLISDDKFSEFINSKTDMGYGVVDSEFIIIDTSNIHMQIKNYKGKLKTIIDIRDNIIRNRPISSCIDELIKFITEEMNDNFYKFIFTCTCRYDGKKFDDHFCIIPIDCTEYTGSRCNREDFTNEVDDVAVVMLYDYCNTRYGVNVSIMSSDNFDFFFMTQDYYSPIRRAVFSNEVQSNVINWDEINIVHENFEFNKYNKLTLFEDEFKARITKT